MRIRLESLLEGANRATGAVAVIDVFRAFTTGAVALANGAEKIIMVSSIQQALDLREAGVGQVCAGEANSIKPPEFEYGNSPSEIEYVEFNGITLIQRTSAGTQGIVACRNADRLYATALVTAPATARALAFGNPETISLVAMGENGEERTDEDEMCAVHIRHLLEGHQGDPDAIRRVIQAGDAPSRFLDPTRPDSPLADLAICLDIGRYNFAIRVRQEGPYLVARKEIPA